MYLKKISFAYLKIRIRRLNDLNPYHAKLPCTLLLEFVLILEPWLHWDRLRIF